ncbi:MAG: BNR-4 repeat-containing protein [Bacteroidota bacterium]
MRANLYRYSRLLGCITTILMVTAYPFNLLAQDLSNAKIDGYRGIWFELNQKYPYGDKYSGALSTYTAKHIPLAIYAKDVDKTFFVYGGTLDQISRYLLCMIGVFDHATGMVSKPTVVYDKQGVDDPHDNPSLLIDEDGYLWVFVSGRGTLRPGFKFRSDSPYQIDRFIEVSEEEFTYPQVHRLRDGFIHFFTKYTGRRQLYFETTTDGLEWTEDRGLAAIPQNVGEASGHYQVSGVFEDQMVGSFFNRHPSGDPDQRTDLYYLQSADFGQTWTNAAGKTMDLPLTLVGSPARVIDYASQGKNVYMKDMSFDSLGHPVCLYIRSNGHEPGPGSAPYEWCITRWDGNRWQTSVVTVSDHNYDMGSLFISTEAWKVVGPTEDGPQKWGVGGEIAIWQSMDQGQSWQREMMLTEDSPLNHAYVRRPVNHKAPFSLFWSDGHAHEFGQSELYFGNMQGEVWKLPYEMTSDYQKPVRVK